jgi:2-keto-3-deoxy-6-phosphogluconate aldolase
MRKTPDDRVGQWPPDFADRPKAMPVIAILRGGRIDEWVQVSEAIIAASLTPIECFAALDAGADA